MKRKPLKKAAPSIKSSGRGERMRIGSPYMLISKSGLVFKGKLLSVGKGNGRRIVVFTNVA